MTVAEGSKADRVRSKAMMNQTAGSYPALACKWALNLILVPGIVYLLSISAEKMPLLIIELAQGKLRMDRSPKHSLAGSLQSPNIHALTSKVWQQAKNVALIPICSWRDYDSLFYVHRNDCQR